MMISWNLPHGSDNNDERQHEITSTLRHVYGVYKKPSNCELLMHLSGDMEEELSNADKLPQPKNGESQLDAIWNFVRARQLAGTKRHRVTANRFMGTVSEAISLPGRSSA